VHDYLGIPYKMGGRATMDVTGRRAGVATQEAGLVCTSFVDVVMSRYLYDSANRQLKSYKCRKGGDIFDKRGMTLVRSKVEPAKLASAGLRRDQVYGVVFRMKNEWEKKGKKREAGSRMHVGFLAFHNGRLFLIHGSSPMVHIVPWRRFVNKYGRELDKYGGQATKGPKYLSVYRLRPRPSRRT
jgi:hypothetical protein